MIPPVLETHSGITVVRDDLFPGGTKARYIPYLFERCDELVYASPVEGGAQVALAHVAREMGKYATIFVAQRRVPHPRNLQAKALGAKVLRVRPGYLSCVSKRAREYCERSGATLAPFGLDFPEAEQAISAAARMIPFKPREVWCAAGSGVLARALAAAWPEAERHVVQVGRALSPDEVAGATIHVYPIPFSRRGPAAPFPSDPHYDSKAWDFCAKRRSHSEGCLFWNVLGGTTIPSAVNRVSPQTCRARNPARTFGRC